MAQLPVSTLVPTSNGEIVQIIEFTKIKKAPGYDLITEKILRELPKEGLRYITHLFNAILRTGFFPPQWKMA